MARCIVREVKEGRGSPHGGVFLDISWIKERIPNSAEHIKRKLPSMYHQFKQLADIDITREPMEVGPTTHYMMGGVRVDAESQMSTVPGLFAAGECGAGLHGANRLGGNSLSDLLVFGKRAGEHAAAFAREQGAGRIDEAQVEAAAKRLFAPFERHGEPGAEGPYQLQHELQDDDAEPGRHRPHRGGDGAGPGGDRAASAQRAAAVAVAGNREYNPGWHTALDLPNLLTVSEAVTRAALERRESRGAQFRADYPGEGSGFGAVNIVVRKEPDGGMQISRVPVVPVTPELQAIIEEMK